MAYAMLKQRAHELIDGLEPRKVGAAVAALELVAAPNQEFLHEVPLGDEEISAEEEAAVAAAKADTRPTLSTDEMLARLGFTQADLDRGVLPEPEPQRNA